MNCPREISLYDLIGRYVHGDISESQGEILLRYLDEDPNAMKILQRNLLLDLYLDQIYTVRQKDVVSSIQEKHFLHLRDFIDPSNFPSGIISDLLEIERANGPSRPSHDSSEFAEVSSFHPGTELKFLDRFEFDPELNTPLICTDPLEITSDGSCIPQSVREKLQHKRNRRLLYFGGAFLAAFLVIFSASLIWNALVPDRSDDSFLSVAEITEVIDVQWPSAEKSFKRGQKIAEGPIIFQSGLVELSYHNGTRMILNGPCEYFVRGKKNSFCSEGSISAAISPTAKGFEIATPFGNVVDQSTEFFMEVTKSAWHTSVVKGRVDFMLSEHPRTPLVQGQGVQVDAHCKVQEIPADTDRYIDRKEMENRTWEYTQKIESENRVRHEEQDSLPGLLASFRFGDGNTQTIVNRSRYGKDVCRQLVLNDCRADEGFLSHTRSVAFDRDNSRGQTHIAGQYDSITCIVHLRVNRLANQGNVVFANNDFFGRSGSIFWQVSREGKLQFFLSGQKTNEPILFESPVILSRPQWGTWQKLAVVLDRTNKTVTQYCDGKMVSQKAWIPKEKLQLEDLMLGNMTTNTIGKNKRNLNGAIESICFFDRALTADEIATW